MPRLPRRQNGTSPIEEARAVCSSGQDKEGFEVRFINSTIGYGVFAERDFHKGDFLLEYIGEHVSASEGERREEDYVDEGSFLFFYGKECIDATYSTCKCRMVNDEVASRANTRMKPIRVGGETRFCLFAMRQICKGPSSSGVGHPPSKVHHSEEWGNPDIPSCSGVAKHPGDLPNTSQQSLGWYNSDSDNNSDYNTDQEPVQDEAPMREKQSKRRKQSEVPNDPEPVQTKASTRGKQSRRGKQSKGGKQPEVPKDNSDSDTDQEPVQDNAPMREKQSKRKKQSEVPKARKYTKWSEESTILVRDHFQEYYDESAEKKLPGRKEILEFLESNNLEFDWLTVKTKIMNQIRLEKERAEKRRAEWR